MSNEIIGKYLEASKGNETPLHGASMEVEISASVPKLKESGRLRALRVISRVGRVSYRVLGFQGSNTVKSQIIARYLQAEQQNQANPKLAINPENYNFRYKCVRDTDKGAGVYVFSLSPKISAIGLFKGELWVDSQTGLPVFEKGKFVKNPSLFFKKVYFERVFALRGGKALPEHMTSVITTRMVGKVQLDIDYSNFSEMPDDKDISSTPVSLSVLPSRYGSRH